MNGCEKKGIPIPGTSIVIYGPEALGPPKVIVREGTFPIGDYSHWVGHHVAVFGIAVESFLDVYLQLNGEEVNMVLDKVADYIALVPTVTKTKTEFPKTTGSPCLAQFEDESWYRARIVEDLGDDVYQVYFVDYGNYYKVHSDKLMHCPDDLVDYVEGITHVALHGYTGDESRDEAEILAKYVVEHDLIAKIESSSFEIKGKTRMLVNLFTAEGVPIRSLIEEGMKKKKEMQINTEGTVAPVEEEEKKELITKDEEKKELITKDEEVLSDSSTASATSTTSEPVLTEESPESGEIPILKPGAGSNGEWEPVRQLPPKPAEVEVSIVVAPAAVETPVKEEILGIPKVQKSEKKMFEIPLPPKVQKLEQFEDAVDSRSGPITIPRKSSLPPALVEVNSPGELEGIPVDKPSDKFLQEKEAWLIAKLNLEKIIEDQKQELELKDKFLKEYRSQVETLSRELLSSKSESAKKDETLNLLNSRLTQLHSELVQNEGASQHIQHLESQSAIQLGEINNLRSIVNLLEGKMYQFQTELDAKKSELESQIQFNSELVTKKQNLAKELASHKLMEKDLRSQEALLKEALKNYEQKIEKLLAELQGKERDWEEGLNGQKELKKENEELREQLLNVEQELETKLKPRSRGGSFAELSTWTPRSPGLPPDYEARVTEHKLAVERLTETLSQIVKINSMEARIQQGKIDQLSSELSARYTHFQLKPDA